MSDIVEELRASNNEWLEKTEWVQEEISKGILPCKYLGFHRADVMTYEIQRLRKENEFLMKNADKFEDGIDWIQRAIQAEVECESLRAELASVNKQLHEAIQSDAESIAMFRKARDERDALRAELDAIKPHPHCDRSCMFQCSQSAPSVPVAAIEKVLAEVMEIAVSNGANSVSMPDEYVEIAAWLHSLPAAPKSEGE